MLQALSVSAARLPRLQLYFEPPMTGAVDAITRCMLDELDAIQLHESEPSTGQFAKDTKFSFSLTFFFSAENHYFVSAA
jgi:hypothetical protein